MELWNQIPIKAWIQSEKRSYIITDNTFGAGWDKAISIGTESQYMHIFVIVVIRSRWALIVI